MGRHKAIRQFRATVAESGARVCHTGARNVWGWDPLETIGKIREAWDLFLGRGVGIHLIEEICTRDLCLGLDCSNVLFMRNLDTGDLSALPW